MTHTEIRLQNDLASKRATRARFYQRKHQQAVHRHDERRAASLRAEAARDGIIINKPLGIGL